MGERTIGAEKRFSRSKPFKNTLGYSWEECKVGLAPLVSFPSRPGRGFLLVFAKGERKRRQGYL